MSTVALTRAVSPALQNCALTHVDRVEVDLALAQRQHAAYRQTLADLGCEVICLEADPEQPDCVFVEDTAVVVDEVAVSTRPGATSRLAEAAAVRRVLARYRRVVAMSEPAALDGGDVLRLGRTLYVGLSSRTNEAGVAQLEAAVKPHGYRVESVAVAACLHLKTAVTQIGEDRLLLNPAWVDPAAFPGFHHVACDPSEPFGGNAVRIGTSLVYAGEHRRTAERLVRAGYDVRLVEFSELAKAEGGVTCCSVLLGQD